MTYNEFVFDSSDEFDVVDVKQQAGKVIISIVAKRKSGKCPSCCMISSKMHSYYQRSIMDLPMLGKETWISLKARKFFCTNNPCHKKIFPQRFEKHFIKGRKMTERVQDKILKVALHMGGNGGERICRLMNMPVSSSSLIRSVDKAP